jgi:hypothetical protein
MTWCFLAEFLFYFGQSETRINGLGQNVQSLEDLLRCFLPSFSSFGSGVSEEKIKMWKVNWRQTTDAKSSHCLWQGEQIKFSSYSHKYWPEWVVCSKSQSHWLIIKQDNLIFLSCSLDIKCQKCFFCSISQGLGSPSLLACFMSKYVLNN